MVKKLQILAVIVVLLLGVTSCQSGKVSQEAGQFQGSYTIEQSPPGTAVKYLSGETVYVPIYPSVYYSKDLRTYDLIVTLSIRNISMDHSIKITKIDYHKTNGDLIKGYVEQGSLVLKPLQTVQLVINQDSSIGTSADVIVEWVAESRINSPIVEAMMISASGQMGLSFVTSGRVIKKLGGD